MRKVALVFVLAVFAPSLVLAWLAIRSLRDQQFVLERQESLLYQGVTDSIARQVEALLAQKQHEFGLQVEEMLTSRSISNAALSCDTVLRSNWPIAKVGFSMTTNGVLLCPSPQSSSEAGSFRADNAKFLTGSETAEVYWNTGNNPKSVLNSSVLEYGGSSNGNNRDAAANNQSSSRSFWPDFSLTKQKAPQARNIYPQQQAAEFKGRDKDRSDEAQQPVQLQFSKAIPADAEFQQLIGESSEGTLARFVNNKLNLLLWYRPPRDSRYIFGAQLDLARLSADLQELVRSVDPSLAEDVCVAILDDSAKPAALSRDNFQANWRHPFVATEIGEVLPHWEAAVYLLNPAKLSQSARTIKLTLGLLIASLVLAIGVGSWLIVTDLNRQLTLARQKTDFVSNVSHELKTPLTSIRMFSELLAEGRVTEPAKQRSYFNIITAETARLTRLINNVLDFSRMERGEKKYNIRDCDLIGIARETFETYRPHLENNGFHVECQFTQSTMPIKGDCDALAQIIVNLLSNAEKYSNSRKEIALQAEQRDGPLPCAEVRVFDRGPGVPRGSEEKIFEKFYRAHDSLSSGIQGSGLGLTLARQIARAHGGDVVYQPREGGGSCFCLRLPLIQQT
jgi:signal transduction histidine kinase